MCPSGGTLVTFHNLGAVPEGHFGGTLGSLLGCLGVILKVLCRRFGSTLGLLKR